MSGAHKAQITFHCDSNSNEKYYYFPPHKTSSSSITHQNFRKKFGLRSGNRFCVASYLFRWVQRDAGEADRPSGSGRGGGMAGRVGAESIEDVREKEGPGRGISPGSKRNGPPAKEYEEGTQHRQGHRATVASRAVRRARCTTSPLAAPLSPAYRLRRGQGKIFLF